MRKRQLRAPMSKYLRFKILTRDRYCCQYCGQCAPNVVLEVDHIVPVCRGGGNDPLNLVASCYACNQGKGTGRHLRTFDDGVKYLMGIRALLFEKFPEDMETHEDQGGNIMLWLREIHRVLFMKERILGIAKISKTLNEFIVESHRARDLDFVHEVSSEIYRSRLN